MASSSTETVVNIAEWATVAFTILAAASGFIFVVKGRQVKKIEAARAKTAQEGIELRLSEQQERAAIAERELLLTQRIMRPRRFPTADVVGDPAVRAKYAALNEFAGTRVFFFVAPDTEAQEFAAELWFVLKEAGWKPAQTRGMYGNPGVGVYSGRFVEGTVTPDARDSRAGIAVAHLTNAVLEMQGIGTGPPIRNMPEDMLPPAYTRPQGTMAITVGLRDVELQLREIRGSGKKP